MPVLISPNMNLPVPVVGVDIGPDWATNINACLSAIDSHDHTPGQGVPITPAAININTNLPMNNNNLTSTRTVRFTPQGAVLGAPADVGVLYEVGADLYYNDGAGNQIRFTQSGSLAGAAGTITGLPSGTASASFAAGTFTFQAATATGASIDAASFILRNNTPGSFGLTLSPPSGMISNTTITLPSLPASIGVMSIDSSGNITTAPQGVAQVPLGGIIATTPNLTGAYVCTATTVADPLTGYVLCQGQVLSDVSSPMNGDTIPDLTTQQFLMGDVASGSMGGATNIALAHVHGMNNHTHLMLHYHQWGVTDGSSSLQGLTTGNSSQANFNYGAGINITVSGNTQSGSGVTPQYLGAANKFYTSGAMGTVAGDGSNARTGVNNPDDTESALSTYDNRPKYFSVVYVMRVV